ncbi:MAG: DUF2631 domain-containing protein [Pseudonocardiaceae bacterium]|nr:DUF2631 domain-containing protein [Pseudonocardiaceae bacterium]
MAAAPSTSVDEHEHTSVDEQEHSSTELARHASHPHAVDADEPSADWGWHGSFPIGGRVAGWLSTVGLFFMAINGHGPATENWWLLGIVGVLVVLLIAHEVNQRPS